MTPVLTVLLFGTAAHAEGYEFENGVTFVNPDSNRFVLEDHDTEPADPLSDEGEWVYYYDNEGRGDNKVASFFLRVQPVGDASPDVVDAWVASWFDRVRDMYVGDYNVSREQRGPTQTITLGSGEDAEFWSIDFRINRNNRTPYGMVARLDDKVIVLWIISGAEATSATRSAFELIVSGIRVTSSELADD